MAKTNTGKTNAKYPPPEDRTPPERHGTHYNANEVPVDRLVLFDKIFSEDDNNNDDDEDDDYFPENPSGSVLQPSLNPYDKDRKIIEANKALFSEPVPRRSPPRVTFSQNPEWLFYDPDDVYDSDSVASADPTQVFVGESRVTHIPKERANVTHEGIFNSDLLLVLVKAEHSTITNGNKEFESEDMCIGIYRKTGNNNSNYKDGGYEKICSHSEETRQKVESANNVESINCEEFLQEITKHESELNENHLQNNICKENTSGITIKVTNFDSFDSNSDNEKSGKLNVYIPLLNSDCNYNFIENFQSESASENKANNVEGGIEEEEEEEGGGVDNDDGDDSDDEEEDDVEEEKEEKNENKEAALDNKVENKCEYKLQQLNITHKGNQDENNHSTFEGNQQLEIVREYDVYDKKEPQLEHDHYSTVQKHTLKSKETVKAYRKVAENTKFIKDKLYLENLNKKETVQNNIKAINTKTDKKLINTTQNLTGCTKVDDNAKSQSKSMVIKKKIRHGDKSNPEIKNEICCSNNKKFNRPKSCTEKKIQPISSSALARPYTAPARRMCCQWGQPRLPEYNGFRSEYGLSAEQLQERKRLKKEAVKEKHKLKIQKRIEEEQKCKENEAKFCAWLEGKRQQAKLRYLRNQQIKAASSQPYYAPTAHLKKIDVFPRPKKALKSEIIYYLSLDELLNSTKNGERKTYRIYLGVPVE